MSQVQTTLLIDIREQLAPPALHEAIWQLCIAGGWQYGHQSTGENGVPFWKLDLTGLPVLDSLWQLSQPACEAAAGHPLRVQRQYANGHTYGQGGQAHVDDTREGCYTLLYYPMPVWRPEWEGETIFYNAAQEVACALLPKPNRAVLFDSRIPHLGRAPARICTELRVTVAFKLEPVG